jgi:Na+-translocating ferredoxin:NAD+ oxidoreductase RnfC subunit
MDMARMRLARQQSEQAKAQEEARLLKEENERIRQEQAQAKAKEDAIRLEKEAAEAKLRQMEAEAKAKAEREAQEEAKRLYLTSAATDFEKIEDVQHRLRGFELPEASSEFGQKLMADIRYLLNKIDGHISQNIEKLKA